MEKESGLRCRLLQAAGIDVHTTLMNVCIISGESSAVFKTFGTYTSELYLLRNFLIENNVRDVVMES